MQKIIQNFIYLPVDFFTLIEKNLPSQLGKFWQKASLPFYASAWVGVFIALADTIDF